MLKPEERFFALEGSIYPGGPSTWYIMDWDQRRLVSVTMDEELESEDPAVEHLSKHIDDLEPDVFEIRVSSQGDLISTSTDPEDDNTFCPFYAPLEAIEKPEDIQVVPRSKLQELGRLGPLVDLVTDLQTSKPSEKMSWKVVASGSQPSISQEELSMRTDLESSNSARIGDLGYSQARNDVDGVLLTVYELITGDYELRSMEHEQQKVSDIEGIEWTKHPDVQLDHPVAEFRKVLDQWSSERRKDSNRINTFKDAPNYIEWPTMPQPPPSEVVINYTTGPVKEPKVLWSTERRDMLAQGKVVLNWQRPAQIKLTPEDRILETGEYI
ncbi:hypothetical protein HYE68_000837 [Fusarium pseudograminearum]|nr:hypothetical protein HYE68_000837 [Fusarium pseudograminearum]